MKKHCVHWTILRLTKYVCVCFQSIISITTMNHSSIHSRKARTVRGMLGGRTCEELWNHLENIIKRLDDMEIECDLILFHPYDNWGFSQFSQTDNIRYLDYCIRRLGHLKISGGILRMSMACAWGTNQWRTGSRSRSLWHSTTRIIICCQTIIVSFHGMYHGRISHTAPIRPSALQMSPMLSTSLENRSWWMSAVTRAISRNSEGACQRKR